MTRHALCIAVAIAILPMSAFVAFADIIASRTLRVGTIVAESDITFSDHGAAETAESIIGREVKRSVYVGRAISTDDVGPVTIVDRNDIVRLFYRNNGLGIRTEARALEAGGLGEQITVMNLDTRVTLRALIVGNKRVRVEK